MTRSQLQTVWNLCQFIMAATLVYVVSSVWYHRGFDDGGSDSIYWEGWQDAMTQTDYGRIPYDSTKALR